MYPMLQAREKNWSNREQIPHFFDKQRSFYGGRQYPAGISSFKVETLLMLGIFCVLLRCT